VSGTISGPTGASSASESISTSGTRSRLSARAKSDLASTAGLLAALLAIVATIAPWWVLSTSDPGGTSTVSFYAGTSVTVYTTGGGGATTYSAIGVPTVGDLYTAILAGLVVLAVLAGAVAVHGFAAARGRWGSPRLRWMGRAGLLSAVLLALLLALAAPLAQSPLYQHDNPKDACSSATPPPACGSFWGSSDQGAIANVWGAGFGWWADAVATGLLAAMLFFEVAVAAPPVPAPSAVAPTVESAPSSKEERSPKPGGPLSIVDLRRLAELKRLSDTGQVPPSSFQEAKQRLLDAAPPADLAGPNPRTPLPSEELSLLKRLHDSGALTDEEYEILERRALLWI